MQQEQAAFFIPRMGVSAVPIDLLRHNPFLFQNQPDGGKCPFMTEKIGG